MSVNYYDKISQTLTAVSGQRVWVGTKQEHDDQKQAGTLPRNAIIYITDDEEELAQEVTEDDPRAVTSGAVYDATQSKMSYVNNGILGAKNLLPNNATTQTIGGVVFTVNTDGSIDISGTYTGIAGTYSVSDNFLLKKGVYRLSRGTHSTPCPSLYLFKISDSSVLAELTIDSDTEEIEFTLNSDETVRCYMWYLPNKTYNTTFYPMLRLASDTDSTYQPYTMTNKELTDSVSKMTWKTVATANSIAASGTTVSLHADTIHNKQDVRVTYYTNNARIPLTQYGSTGTAREYRGSVVSPDSSATRLGFVLRWENADLNTCTITYYTNGTATALNTAVSVQVWE